MKQFKFRVYCEVTQQGADQCDAWNRLVMNVHDDLDGEGTVIYRKREGYPDPVYSAVITKLKHLDSEEVNIDKNKTE